jgi:hypothetical protein
MPSDLTAGNSLDVGDSSGILEHADCRLERNAMLSPVDAAFLLIPGEEHLYLQKCITTARSQVSEGRVPDEMASPI